MALTQNITVARRGPPKSNTYGKPVAPGEVIYAGSLFGVNAANQAVRIQTGGIVAFMGMALNGINNVGQSGASQQDVISSNDTYALTVPGAVPANINAKVYATDDGTLTLTAPGSGFAGVVGYLEDVDAVTGQTFVKVQGH